MTEPLPPWTEWCRTYLATVAVRPFNPEGATAWERELFELTQGRGLPIVDDILFGRDTHEGRLEPELADRSALWKEPFAWSPSRGAFFLEPEVAGYSVCTKSADVAYPWQRWIEGLILQLQLQLPAFPPPIKIFDLDVRSRDYLSPLYSRLRLRPVEETSLHVDPVFSNETTVFLRHAHQIYTTDIDSFCEALRASHDVGVGGYVNTSAFSEAPLPVDPRPEQVVAELTWQTRWAELRTRVGPTSVVQQITVLGQPLETAIVRPTRSLRHRVFESPRGSKRLMQWAQRRDIVRSSLSFDRAGLFGWAERHRVPTEGLDALLQLEREWGGIMSFGRSDPLYRPYFVFGVAACEEVLRREGRFHEKDTSGKKDYCGHGPGGDVYYPISSGYPFWTWEKHRLWLIGEQAEGELFYEDSGAIWQWHLWEGRGFRVVAGTARSFFERLALEDWLDKEICSYQVRFQARADREVAAELGLSLVPEASDWMLTTYESATLWMWQTIQYGPHFAELRIVSIDPEAILRAVRIVRAVCPTAKIRTGSERLQDEITKAGFGDPDMWYYTFEELEKEQGGPEEPPAASTR